MLCAIPIEISNRELDGVLYLALKLVQRGLPVMFGERMVTQYVKNNNEPVLYFDIEQYVPINRKVIADGGAVFNLNSEGFAFLCDEKFISIFEHIRDDVTKIFLWGKRQREVVSRQLPDLMQDRLVVSGHPSFDMAQERFVPYYRNESILQCHGEDYILVNANSGIFNHAMGLENYLKMIQKMDEWQIYRDEDYLKFIRTQSEYQEKVANGMLELVAHLARAFPKRHVIIRPHPTEGMDFYTKPLKRYPNVFVTNEGRVREWIASARVVVHHDCTTSLEALLMGKPVIQFRPVYDERFNDPLLAGIGLATGKVEEAEAIVRDGEMPVGLRERQLANLEPSLANIGFVAAEMIADQAVDVARGVVNTWIPEPLGFWGNVKCWRKHLSKQLRARQPGRNGRKVRYALSKFPRLSLDAVQLRLDKLRVIEPSLPEVDVTSLTLNTFLMRPRTTMD
ncbi:surface carbohydrate biosynthesis protein [Pseudodesulfovibrio alkaliphilus]|nr:surface carbohydrate biosynthesis protein [Pseudodesulfovibrio alkaliphilus]